MTEDGGNGGRKCDSTAAEVHTKKSYWRERRNKTENKIQWTSNVYSLPSGTLCVYLAQRAKPMPMETRSFIYEKLEYSQIQWFYIAGNFKLKWHLGLFHYVCESFPMQLVVHTGYDYEYFRGSKISQSFRRRAPRFDDIGMYAVFGPIFLFLWKSWSLDNNIQSRSLYALPPVLESSRENDWNKTPLATRRPHLLS